MARKRKTNQQIDLVGFLDIISIMNVLILLIISTLALGLGNNKTKARSKQDTSTAPPLVRAVSNDGILVTTPVTYLMCNQNELTVHRPSDNRIMQRIRHGDSEEMRGFASFIEARAYLAVKPSCFKSYELIKTMIIASGSSVGAEPIPEGADSPWEIRSSP